MITKKIYFQTFTENTDYFPDNKVFWHESNVDKPSKFNNDLYFMNKLANSKDVEITAYALLTYVYRKDIIMIAPISRWLSSQQNSFGGYDNTQVRMKRFKIYKNK